MTSTRELPIKGFDNYYVKGESVYSRRYGRPVKAGKNDVVQLWRDRRVYAYSRAKIIWCAIYETDPTTIPRDYAFTQKGGVPVCEKFGDKMSRVRKECSAVYDIEKTKNDYRVMMSFSALALNVISGDSDALRLAYTFLRSYRAELVTYAVLTGGVGKQRACEIADDAIDITYDTIKSFKKAVPNPLGYMKRMVRAIIVDKRKTKNSNFENV